MGEGGRGELEELSSWEGSTFSWRCPRRWPDVLKGAGEEVSWGSAQESKNSHRNKIWVLGTLRGELLRGREKDGVALLASCAWKTPPCQAAAALAAVQSSEKVVRPCNDDIFPRHLGLAGEARRHSLQLGPAGTNLLPVLQLRRAVTPAPSRLCSALCRCLCFAARGLACFTMPPFPLVPPIGICPEVEGSQGLPGAGEQGQGVTEENWGRIW